MTTIVIDEVIDIQRMTTQDASTFLDFKYSVYTIREQIPISKIIPFLSLSKARTSYQLIIVLYLYYYNYGGQKGTQCMLF